MDEVIKLELLDKYYRDYNYFIATDEPELAAQALSEIQKLKAK